MYNGKINIFNLLKTISYDNFFYDQYLFTYLKYEVQHIFKA